jgi:tRNA-dihydrouridine synthase
MIGRGAFGKPWIFNQVNHYLMNETSMVNPSFQERIEICLKHYQLALQSCGKERGIKEMRKHIGWYLKNMPESHAVKKEIFLMNSSDEVQNRLRSYEKQLSSWQKTKDLTKT